MYKKPVIVFEGIEGSGKSYHSKKVSNYLKKKKLLGKFSAFTIAGAAIGVTNKKFKKWHSTFFDNLIISIKLHKIENKYYSF